MSFSTNLYRNQCINLPDVKHKGFTNLFLFQIPGSQYLGSWRLQKSSGMGEKGEVYCHCHNNLWYYFLGTHDNNGSSRSLKKETNETLISKIGPDPTSIVGKLKPTAAILEWPPEEYSGVSEKKMRTLIFSTWIWRTKCVHWTLTKVSLFLFVTSLKFPIWPPVVAPIWPPLATIKSYCEAHKIV